MIDTTALFGSTTPEPPSPALGERGQSGFMATLGDVLAGMLDPEGLHLVAAISGHPDHPTGDDQQGGDDAPSGSAPDAPGLAGAHIAAALRINGLASAPTDPASVPVTTPASVPVTTSAPETVGAAAAAAPAAAGLPGEGQTQAQPNGAAPVTPAENTSHFPNEPTDPTRSRPAVPTDPVPRGLGLLDPDGDLGQRPEFDTRIRSTHDARSANGTRVAIHEVRMETDPDGVRPSAVRSDVTAPTRRATIDGPIPVDRPGPPPVHHARPIPADGAPQHRDLAALGLETTSRGDVIEVPQASGAPEEGPAMDRGPSEVRDPSPIPGTALTTQLGPRSAVTAPIVERLVQAVEMLQHQPPPRSLVVEIPELDGLQIRVAIRPDGAIHLAIQGDRVADLAMPILDAARAALSERGFDMAHDSPRRQHRDHEDAERPPGPRRTPAPEPRGLRI